jgi:hypothetical protein
VTLAELEALLTVQDLDTALDRLAHRRASLAERAELETRLAGLRAGTDRRDELRARRDEVLAQEQRLDDEGRALAQHVADVDKKLYSGSVVSPRELQAMQADLDMLRRQLSTVEDRELEVMEERERLDGELAALDAQLAAQEAEVQRLGSAIGLAEAEIDAEIAREAAARAEAAAPVGAALLGDYERRRARNKGFGAARLVGTTCQACHLTIPSTEAERIRRAAGAEVAYCDNCSAILVP